jgi:hypothetical protein
MANRINDQMKFFFYISLVVKIGLVVLVDPDYQASFHCSIEQFWLANFC